MSKTIKGQKGSGYEYWSKVANSDGKWSSLFHGPFSKRLRNRKVRRKGKQQSTSKD